MAQYTAKQAQEVCGVAISELLYHAGKQQRVGCVQVLNNPLLRANSQLAGPQMNHVTYNHKNEKEIKM